MEAGGKRQVSRWVVVMSKPEITGGSVRIKLCLFTGAQSALAINADLHFTMSELDI